MSTAVDGGGGSEERSKFRCLDVARYAVAAAVTVIVMVVIVNAVKVVLRPESLQLSVDRGSIFTTTTTTTTQHPPPRLEQEQEQEQEPSLGMELNLRAQNPSGRVRMYYVGVTGYLFDNRTSASASSDPAYDCVAYLPLKDMAVVQQEALDNSLRLSVRRQQQMDPSYFDLLYNNGSRSSSISDMTLRLDGNLVTEVTSELNKTRSATYYCDQLLVGGDRDDEASKYSHHCPSTSRAAAAGDEHGFTVVDTSSLKPHAAAACSGHRQQVIPPHKGTWVPLLYRHLGPCSPSSSSSLAELLRQDQLRVDHIHRRLMRLSSSSSSEDVVRVSKQQARLKEPVRFEVIRLHDHQQPVIQVTLGSERQQQASGGEPASGVVQTVVLDTATDVPWVQCHGQPPPATTETGSSSAYDPARSGTYAAVPCNSQACAELGRLYRSACVNDQSQYRVPIIPNKSTASSSSSGTYSSDLLAVDSTTTITFRFGCSHAEQGSGSGSFDDDNTTTGVMALGGGPESLVSQTAATYGNAFSYCIPAATERSRSQPGFFVLGSPAPPDTDLSAAGYAVTPMLRYAQVPTLYRVRLLAVAVGGQQLNVTPSVFAAGSVLDSRTAVTRLPATAYQALREAFRSRMAAYREAPPKGSLDTCYDFTGAFVVMVPRIALLFEGRDAAVEVELDRPGILFRDCLAFASNSDDRMAGILGNVQQQTMEVLYNVGGGSVGFRRGAC